MNTEIPGVILRTPESYADERGSFTEIYRASDYPETFVQSNHSRSRAGVLRGLHYHRGQADLWYVSSGTAQVVLADLRTPDRSPAIATFELSGDHPTTVYIPAGVAHGYLALTDCEVIYWVTNYYDSTDEYGVAWDDPMLGVPWKQDAPILSERDRTNPKLDWDAIGTFP